MPVCQCYFLKDKCAGVYPIVTVLFFYTRQLSKITQYIEQRCRL